MWHNDDMKEFENCPPIKELSIIGDLAAISAHALFTFVDSLPTSLTKLNLAGTEVVGDPADKFWWDHW